MSTLKNLICIKTYTIRNKLNNNNKKKTFRTSSLKTKSCCRMKVKKTKVHGIAMPCFSVESLSIVKQPLLPNRSIDQYIPNQNSNRIFFVEIGG